MNDIWIVIIEDRHADVDAYPFSTEEAAITAAQKAVTDGARHPEDKDEWDTELNAAMLVDGWVFYTRYSSEGDCVRVIKRIMGRMP
jgi:hypothetical protein